MSKFREQIKEEIKEEVGDLIYEKAKAEIRKKISDRFQSVLSRFLRFFGFKRKRKESLGKISEELKSKQEVFMSKTTLGILELFTLKYIETAIEISTSTVIENHHNGSMQNRIVEKINISDKEKNQNTESNESSVTNEGDDQ